MSKTFHCPSCGAALENVDFTKPTTRCPYCGTVVTIPANLRERPARSSTPEYQPQVVINLGDYAQQPYGNTINRRRSNPAGCIFTLLILVIVFAIVGGGILVATNSMSTFTDVIDSLNTPGAMGTLTGGNIGAIISTAAPRNLEVLLQFGGDGTGNGKFKDGRWVAIDGLGGIYVADYNSNGRLQAFDKQGNYLTTFTAEARAKSIPIRCLAADRKGIVYVCRDGYIQKFNSESGEAAGEIRDPQNDYIDTMTFLPNGNIIAITSGADDDLIFMNPAGKVLNRIKKIVSTQTENSQTSLDLAADGLGNIYIASQRENAIFRFSPEGKFVDRFGNSEPFSTPSSDAEFRGFIGAIALDSQGRIYVTDFDGIKIFSNDGNYLQLVQEPPGSGFIHDMVFNTRDELFVSDGKQIFQVRIRIGQ